MALVALIDASGNAGARIRKELSDRGHQVTATSRAISTGSPRRQALAALIKEYDAVISSVPVTTSNAAVLVGAVRDARVARYLLVGGAGSLKYATPFRLSSPTHQERFEQTPLTVSSFIRAEGSP